MKFDIHKKEREGLLCENSADKKIVSHSKRKLWTFFWGHGEHEWPLQMIYTTTNIFSLSDCNQINNLCLSIPNISNTILVHEGAHSKNSTWQYSYQRTIKSRGSSL